MPELPEVHALAADLDGRLHGRTVARLDLVSFAALKTFDPPVSALDDQVIRGVTMHGKFLDFAVGDLHLIMHLARAGWVRWNDGTRSAPVRPGKSPLAARLILDDGTGINITEAGTKKSLAFYLVH